MSDIRQTVCIMGSYGEGNVGDEAILDGILKEVRAKDAHTQIVVFSHDPAATVREHPGVIAVPPLPAGFKSFFLQTITGNLQRSLYALKAASDIIIGGGGIFYDHGFSKGKNPILVWHLRCRTILRVRKQYRIYAVGVSSLEDERSKEWLRQICDHAERIDVRDESSKQVLNDLGVTKSIGIVDDPALHLSAPKHVKQSSERPHIGLCVRRWHLDDAARQQALTKTLTETIDALITQLNANVTLIPMSIGGDDDRVYAAEVIALCSNKNNVSISSTPHTVESRMKEIAGLDLLVSMRLHGLIFAHLAGTPWIALGYAEKVEQMAKKLGGSDRCIDIDTLEAQSVTQLAQKLLSRV